MADQLDSSPIIEQVLGPATAKLTRFHAKLEKEGEPRGLIGPRDVDIIWERHILNSAALLPFVRTALDAIPSRLYLGEVDGENAPIVGDIGSGGGFPGIVLAALLPHVRFFLIEPMERRCEWLQEVVEELDLNNATIVRARTEELEAILKRKAGGKSGKTRGKGKNSLKSDRSASAKNIGKLNNAGRRRILMQLITQLTRLTTQITLTSLRTPNIPKIPISSTKCCLFTGTPLILMPGSSSKRRTRISPVSISSPAGLSLR